MNHLIPKAHQRRIMEAADCRKLGRDTMEQVLRTAGDLGYSIRDEWISPLANGSWIHSAYLVDEDETVGFNVHFNHPTEEHSDLPGEWYYYFSSGK